MASTANGSWLDADRRRPDVFQGIDYNVLMSSITLFRASLAPRLRNSAAWWLAAIFVLQTGCSAGKKDKHGEIPMTISLSSSGFAAGQPIPKKYTEDGQDRSPPLAWSGVPAETKQLALICDDPDAPSDQPWVHWVIYHLPADLDALPEGVSPKEQLDEPPGALQGLNTWTTGQTIGYRGPAPPPGKPHRYYFTLYALDTMLDLKPKLDKQALLQAMQGHILAEGQLMGTYQR